METKKVHASDFKLPLATKVCTDLNLPSPEMSQIYRHLGYPRGSSPSPPVAERITRAIEGSLPVLEPRGTFSIYAATGRKGRSLHLGDVAISGDIGQYMEGADRVAVFVVTTGEGISTRSANLRQRGDALAAWVLDAFGSWAAETAADVLMKRIERHLGDGEALTLRYSPGYCGMEMSEQRKLFALVGAKAIGVELLPSLLMQPLKSISGLVGLGAKDAITTYRSACDRCPQIDCHMRR